MTWTDRTPSGVMHNATWISLSSSSDGTKLAAVDKGAYLYTSSDSGVTWTQRTNLSGQYLYAVTSSSDGTKLAAAGAFGGNIWTSTDSGVTWTKQTGSGVRDWEGIASSADGTKLVAFDSGGDIYTSTNSGVTWVDRTAAGARNWNAVTSSSDAVRLGAVVNSGDVWTSMDSGVTWTDQTGSSGLGLTSIAASSDGYLLAATPGHGFLYTANLATVPVVTVTPAAPGSDNTSATVLWTTDEATNATINYGTTASYGQSSSDSTFSTTHTFTLTGLSICTTYHYQVSSTAGGLTTTSADATFKTTNCGSGGGVVVGVGPNAPSSGMFGLMPLPKPRPQTITPDGHVTYTDITPPTSSAQQSTTPLTRNIQLWQKGSEVIQLQQFLNAQGFTIAPAGKGSPGHETDLFGPATLIALKKFQKAHNLPVSGYLGPKTRALIQSLR